MQETVAIKCSCVLDECHAKPPNRMGGFTHNPGPFNLTRCQLYTSRLSMILQI